MIRCVLNWLLNLVWPPLSETWYMRNGSVVKFKSCGDDQPFKGVTWMQLWLIFPFCEDEEHAKCPGFYRSATAMADLTCMCDCHTGSFSRPIFWPPLTEQLPHNRIRDRTKH